MNLHEKHPALSREYIDRQFDWEVKLRENREPLLVTPDRMASQLLSAAEEDYQPNAEVCQHEACIDEVNRLWLFHLGRVQQLSAQWQQRDEKGP